MSTVFFFHLLHILMTKINTLLSVKSNYQPLLPTSFDFTVNGLSMSINKKRKSPCKWKRRCHRGRDGRVEEGVQQFPDDRRPAVAAGPRMVARATAANLCC
jgi:hypothetical protein